MENLQPNAGQKKRAKVALSKISVGVTVIISASLPSAARADHLFDPDSGFHKARFARTTIRVCDATGRIDLAGVIGPWNKAAGWRPFTSSCDMPDVAFHAGTATLVQTTYLEPFTSCVVQVASYRVETLQHELAHCLGFADHIYAAEYGSLWVNPAVCDDLSHPAYSAYRGVVSYCESSTPQLWFGIDDQRMLSRAGYAINQGEDAANEVRILGTKVVAGGETGNAVARKDSSADSGAEAPSSNAPRQSPAEVLSVGSNPNSNSTSGEYPNHRASAKPTASYATWALMLALLTLVTSAMIAVFRRLR